MTIENGYIPPEHLRAQFDAAAARMRELRIAERLQGAASLLGMKVQIVDDFDTSGEYGFYPHVILGQEMDPEETRNVLRVYPEPAHPELTAVVAFHESVIDRRPGNVRGGYTIAREIVNDDKRLNAAIVKGVRLITQVDGEMEKRVRRVLNYSVETPSNVRRLLRR